jgi:AraC-like DNA-binding protein
LADDYIVKPFNPELLQLRVNNLISIRKRIRDSFNKHTVYGNIITNLPSAEDKFINKVFDYIKNNIDNPELRIDSFSKDVGMSRVQFYRKIKSITGKTPSSLILEIRMIAAAELIKKTDSNINEIAYQVGFNDSSYFGKCFKVYFGVTPGEYKV